MGRYLIISIFAFALTSCRGSSDQKKENSNIAEEGIVDTTVRSTSERYCFLRTEGTHEQDTTVVQLTIDSDRVEGVMNWIPKEKDSREGVLKGTISGDEINTVWHYIQEGIKDSMVVAFKLTPQQLSQKPLKVNTATGRQETDETADYTVVYKQDNCGD